MNIFSLIRNGDDKSILSKIDSIDFKMHEDLTEMSPLSAACSEGNIKIVKILVMNGADINYRDGDGWTPIVHSIIMMRKSVFSYLLELGAQTDIGDYSNGIDSLMVAAQKEDLFYMRALIERGARLDKVDNYGRTALLWAVTKNPNPYAVEELVSFGAKIDHVDDFGKTALMRASELGKIEMVKVLLRCGADLNVSSREGETAVLLAKRYNHADVVQLLREWNKGNRKIDKRPHGDN